ncbi:MAG: DUF4255 domain-containing protein [Actinoplanes sp.]
MSNHLGIAMATAVLRQLLSEAIAAGPPGSVESATVTTLRPQALAATDATARGINLYLFRVVPNGAAWTVTLPARRTDGSLVARPAQAVDLHYLLTFSGDDTTLEPQRLLGLTVTALAVQPILSRAAIADTVRDTLLSDPQTWQQHADLGRQAEVVRMSMLPLSVEDLTRLWSTLFQSPYRLSLAYQATVVVLEGAVHPATPLPVSERTITVTPATTDD